MNFDDIQGVIMDMDGVLWRGDEPLPGMTEWFDFLRERGLPFATATNNSAKSPADYIAKLARLGVRGINSHQVITSGVATVDYLKMHYPPTTPVYVVGGDGMRALLTEAGYAITEKDAQVVIVGADFNLTYEKLKRATLLIRAGARFIGTNNDATYPTPEGLAPGAGSIVAALRTATDVEPIIIGKPGAAMFEAAVRALKTDAAHTLMVGDRLNTDIVGAHNVGLRTALVLTGVSTRAEVAASPVKPDGVFDGLPELLAAWRDDR